MKGKIVLVPFPFDDLSGHKVRPAVCLTDAIEVFRHVVIAFLSSRVPADLLSTDFVLEPAHPGYAATGMRGGPSTFRLHRLMTVTTGLIRRELGRLAPALQSEIDQRLRDLFKL